MLVVDIEINLALLMEKAWTWRLGMAGVKRTHTSSTDIS